MKHFKQKFLAILFCFGLLISLGGCAQNRDEQQIRDTIGGLISSLKKGDLDQASDYTSDSFSALAMTDFGYPFSQLSGVTEFSLSDLPQPARDSLKGTISAFYEKQYQNLEVEEVQIEDDQATALIRYDGIDPKKAAAALFSGMGSALATLGANSLSVLGLLTQINPQTASTQDLLEILNEADLPAFFDQLTQSFVESADEMSIKERTAEISLFREDDRWLVSGISQ